MSIVFILFNILILNLVFYYLAKKSEIDPVVYINHLNLFLVFSFALFKSILFIHPSTNEMAFKNTFSDIMGVIRYTSLSLENNDQSYFFSMFQVIFKNFYYSVMKYISNINLYSTLILIIISINVIMKKVIGSKNFLFNFLCLFLPIIFTFIGSFRGVPTPIYYDIFTDFIFLIPFCIFFRYLQKKYNILLVLILISLTYFNFEYLSHKKDSIRMDDISKLCLELKTKIGINYLEGFQKKIPRQKFIQFCKNKNSF